jgi:biotin operon repressor
MLELEKGTFCTVPIKLVKGLPSPTQSVFMWICYHTNQEGYCWPSIELLAEESGLCRNATIKAIKELERIGIVFKKRRRNQSTIYKIIIKNQEVDNQEVPNREFLNMNPGSTENKLYKVDNRYSNYNKELNSKELNPILCSFDDFWSAYPLKKSKEKALHSFIKLKIDDALLKTIIEALEMQKQEKIIKLQNKEFVPEWPLPATWLNGKRWQDEINLEIKEEKQNEFNNKSKSTAASRIFGELKEEYAIAKDQGFI